MRFTALDPNRRIEFDGDVGPVRPQRVLSFEPTQSGTRLSVQIGRLKLVGPFKLVLPLLARVGQRIWDKRFARIKERLESSASYRRARSLRVPPEGRLAVAPARGEGESLIY
jgi:hypothetical protein